MPLRAELGSPRRTGQCPTPTPTHQGSVAPRHTRRQARVQTSSSPTQGGRTAARASFVSSFLVSPELRAVVGVLPPQRGLLPAGAAALVGVHETGVSPRRRMSLVGSSAQRTPSRSMLTTGVTPNTERLPPQVSNSTTS